MKKHFLWLVALALVATLPARAETLDDTTIRKIYDDMKGAIHDADKTQALLRERLDDHYTLKTDLTRNVDNQKPQRISVTIDKAQTIKDAAENIARMKMDKFDSNIRSIRFADNNKYAYVDLVTTSAGLISVPTKEDGSARADFNYNITESCTNILSLEQDLVKVMQAQCSDDATFKKP